MKKITLLLGLVLAFFPKSLVAQSMPRWEAGAYLAYLYEPDVKAGPGPAITFEELHLNLHLRYRFAKRWRTGIEYIHTHYWGSPLLQNPYFTFGHFVDFTMISGKWVQVNVRGGLSAGPLLFKGDELPEKRWVVNRVIGASIEFRLTPAFFLQSGFYNHFPLNSIQYKYGFTHPFVGAFVRM